MDEFNQLYEDWIDNVINTRPLTSPRIRQFGDVINVNQQIVNHIYSIRRHLEILDDENERTTTHHRNNFNDVVFDNFEVNDVFNNFGVIGSGDSIFNNGIVSRLFGILLEGNGDLDVNLTSMEDVKVTLTDEQFNKLFQEKITTDNLEKYRSDCNICMDEYKVDDIIVKLGCNHVFHKDCIYGWLCNERVTCPICRKDTREDLN